METVFVATHLIMAICLTGILWLSIPTKNNDENADSKSTIVQSPILRLCSLQNVAAAFYKIIINYLIAFTK
jgi:hypothetical protein